MNLSEIMLIPDQTTRKILCMQFEEIERLRSEVEELKSKNTIAKYPMKRGGKTLEMAFKKVT